MTRAESVWTWYKHWFALSVQHQYIDFEVGLDLNYHWKLTNAYCRKFKRSHCTQSWAQKDELSWNLKVSLEHVATPCFHSYNADLDLRRIENLQERRCLNAETSSYLCDWRNRSGDWLLTGSGGSSRSNCLRRRRLPWFRGFFCGCRRRCGWLVCYWSAGRHGGDRHCVMIMHKNMKFEELKIQEVRLRASKPLSRLTSYPRVGRRLLSAGHPLHWTLHSLVLWTRGWIIPEQKRCSGVWCWRSEGLPVKCND